MKTCPCGGEDYFECCYPYHNDTKVAQDALSLMKSRYSAFVKKEASYLFETSSKTLQSQLTVEELEEASKNTQFVRLQIVNHYVDTVEFKAFYIENNKLHVLHELSDFIIEDSHWRYHSGSIFPASVVNLTRNSPCPCLSGLKFKKCHGS